jgi:hypothetical protein
MDLLSSHWISIRDGSSPHQALVGVVAFVGRSAGKVTNMMLMPMHVVKVPLQMQLALVQPPSIPRR